MPPAPKIKTNRSCYCHCDHCSKFVPFLKRFLNQTMIKVHKNLFLFDWQEYEDWIETRSNLLFRSSVSFTNPLFIEGKKALKDEPYAPDHFPSQYIIVRREGDKEIILT